MHVSISLDVSSLHKHFHLKKGYTFSFFFDKVLTTKFSFIMHLF